MTLPIDPNVSTLTSAGIAVESQTNIVAYLVSAYQSIYGPDVNVQSNSPDGQLIGIYAQSISDVLELVLDTYNSFAVDTAYGVRLDQLVALNGLVRIQGTYTLAQVVVTITQALTIPGLDQTTVPAFTVSDSAGNQYQLQTSYVAGSAGTPTLTFQAVDIGQIQTSANTITSIVTPTTGISTVNNPSVSADVIGIDEETDSQLKIRQQQSFQLASTGPADALEAALKNLPGIADALVIENDTGSVVGDIQANSVWIILNITSATGAQIVQAIYSKKPVGCGLSIVAGGYDYSITRPNGQPFIGYWNLAISQTLYVGFSIIWRGAQILSNADIEAQLAAALIYKLGQNPNIGDVVTAMLTIAPTAIITFNSSTQGVSTNGSTWSSTVSPTTYQNYFGSVTVTIT